MATITRTVKLRRLPSLRKTLIHKPQTTEVIQWGITGSRLCGQIASELREDQWTRGVKCDAIRSSFAEQRLACCPRIPLPPSRSTTNRWPSLAPWWDAMRPQWGGSPAEPKNCDAKSCMRNHQRIFTTRHERNLNSYKCNISMLGSVRWDWQSAVLIRMDLFKLTFQPCNAAALHPYGKIYCMSLVRDIPALAIFTSSHLDHRWQLAGLLTAMEIPQRFPKGCLQMSWCSCEMHCATVHRQSGSSQPSADFGGSLEFHQTMVTTKMC